MSNAAPARAAIGSAFIGRLLSALDQAGRIAILTARTVVAAVTPPYSYGPEFADQCGFILKLCWFPLLVSTIVFGYAAPGIQGGNFLVLFGSIDRLGGIFVIASIREFAPFVTAVVI